MNVENAPIKASQNACIRNINQVIVVDVVVVFCTKIQNRRITRCLVYRRECYRCFEAFSRASAEKKTNRQDTSIGTLWYWAAVLGGNGGLGSQAGKCYTEVRGGGKGWSVSWNLWVLGREWSFVQWVDSCLHGYILKKVKKAKSATLVTVVTRHQQLLLNVARQLIMWLDTNTRKPAPAGLKILTEDRKGQNWSSDYNPHDLIVCVDTTI